MSNANADEGLKRVIGVPSLSLSIISGVIGAGIFVLPAIVSNTLGAFGVYAYLFCAVLFAAILFCYAEIGSHVVTSGGSYAYVEYAFGSLAGYIVNWMYFFGWSILGSAALLNVVADSLAVMFPVFSQPGIRIFFFLALSVFMILLNVTGAKQSVGFVKIITIIKILPLLGIILFGFQMISPANLHAEHVPSIQSFTGTTFILFFAFAGFETSLGASGEIKNPKKTVPLAICIGGIAVLCIYILLQTIVQGTLGSTMDMYKDAPLAAVADRIIGPAGAVILLSSAALSCFGNVTLDILCTSRCLFAGSNHGLFPAFLGKIHSRFGTPYLAIITYGVLIFVFCITGGFQTLAVLANMIILLVYLSVILATVKLRLQNKVDEEKHFKMPGGLFIPFIGIAGIVWLLTSLGKWEFLSTLLFIAAIVVMYFISKRILRRKPGTGTKA